MGKKMRCAPVYFVIAQVRHNPILQLGSYVPQIQEQMRRAGYPDHRPSKAFLIHLSSANIGESALRPVPEAVERHAFLSRDGTSGFIVEQGALSFQTTQYDIFETFSAQFFKGLEIVDAVMTLDYTERLGLRYLDAVVPASAEQDLGMYLAPGVLGLSGRLPGEVPIGFSLTETHIPMPDANLLSRTIIQSGPLGFPMDLQSQGLQVPERFQSIDGMHAIIDTDASQEDRAIFDMAKLGERLDVLHNRIHMVFGASVTEFALAAWK
jgi:uncharacterized protein (TIGR04255 family)